MCVDLNIDYYNISNRTYAVYLGGSTKPGTVILAATTAFKGKHEYTGPETTDVSIPVELV